MDLPAMSHEAVCELVHELQTHQIELELQNEDLRRTQEELSSARDRYSDLYDFAPVGYVTIEQNGLIREVNLTFARMLGLARPALIESPFSAVVCPDDQDTFYQHCRCVRRSNQRDTCQVRLLRKDLDPLCVEIESILIVAGDAGTAHMSSIISDVTERRWALQEITELRERLAVENLVLQEEIRQATGHAGLVGRAPAFQQVLAKVEKVATVNATVLLLGETGTGKELLARDIHARSTRRNRVMISWNCAAIPKTLMESELFGREKGAYTGALSRQAGRFEAAHESTLFLDEVGELPLEVQGKLLRVLEEGKFERLGSCTTRSADVRIIAASNRDLEAEVAAGRFRQDLFYRLSVFPIVLPPLRDRRDDIPDLVWHFIREIGARMGKAGFEEVHGPSLAALQQYHWPGNVRELRNVVEHAMILRDGPVLRIAVPAFPVPLGDRPATLDENQRCYILNVLQLTGWRVRGVGGAAEILGLKPSTLESRIKKLGIERPGKTHGIS